jgi:hypothetical protein
MSGVGIICIWQAIEHIPMFWKVLERSTEALANGGTLIVSTPNPDSLQARWLGRYWPHLDAPRHLYLIPPTWMRKFAETRGLSIEVATTRDIGSLGLNYYGWYIAIRNAIGRHVSQRTVDRLAHRLTATLRRFENAEGRGSSYTIALQKNAE